MKTQHQYSTGHQPIQWVAIMVGAIVVLLISSLIALLNPSARGTRPTTTSTTAMSAVILARPVAANRIFQDEINAAETLDLGDPRSPFFSWPERLHDWQAVLVGGAMPAIQLRPATTNRIFLDEIAGVNGINDGIVVPTVDEVTRQRGPR